MNTIPSVEERLQMGQRLTEKILKPMKQAFVGKDEVIDLLGVCLAARENLFILGPPGTAKSAIVQELARRIEGKIFDYLLTRFTEPNEIFGPFDIRKLREGDLVTNTAGMLPEASFVFLDELLNANSAILNSLLLVLNERIFRRGRETRKLPTLMVVGASNCLPEDDALGALFDRFLLRVCCDNVPASELSEVLSAGWRLDQPREEDSATMGTEDIVQLQSLLPDVNLTNIREAYVALIHRLRNAGIAISDRRAVRVQRLMAASALLCGRLEVNRTDLWILRYIWDTEEQQDVLASIVNDELAQTDPQEQATAHPRSQERTTPDAESLANDLELIAAKLHDPALEDLQRSQLQDQLGVLASQCQWVQNESQRTFLEGKINALLSSTGDSK